MKNLKKIIYISTTFLIFISILTGCAKKTHSSKNFTYQYTYNKLKSEVAEFAKLKNVEIDEKLKISGVWYENIFVSHIGIKSDIKFSDGRPMSILIIKSEKDRKFENTNTEFGSGIYLAKFYLNSDGNGGRIDLEDLNNNRVISLPLINDNGNGGLSCFGSHTCAGATRVSVYYSNCKICIVWECESNCHKACFTIPLCDQITGWLLEKRTERVD